MAQLNFNIPDPLLARLDAAKPDYLDRKGFLCLLLDQSLTPCATLGLSTKGESPSSSKAVSKEKTLKSSNKEIPPSLQAHEDLIREFWKTKAGAKSEASWKLLMTELQKIQDKYDDRVVRDQLELAAASRWKGVSLRNYELFGVNTPKQPYGKPETDWDAIEASLPKMPW